MRPPLPVTQAYLPPLDEYVSYLKSIWENHWLTNDGPLLKKLEVDLAKYLAVENLLYVSNGTVALQLALEALEIRDEVITTPFSYVATSNSILWQKCKPVFCDIDPRDFCIDATKVEALITSKTRAILGVHVYGHPCDVGALDAIARKHDLKVIYDAAHAFGVKVGGRSIASYGDVSTFSFHATKVFHTVEGGAVICNDEAVAKKVSLMRAFGHRQDEYVSVGINGKNSEFHAAMGLVLLPKVDQFIARRKVLCDLYDHELKGLSIQRPVSRLEHDFNYAYYPIILPSENVLLKLVGDLAKDQISPRRYFYPSLNRLPYRRGESCPVSEDISSRVLCLPLHVDLGEGDVARVTDAIKKSM